MYCTVRESHLTGQQEVGCVLVQTAPAARGKGEGGAFLRAPGGTHLSRAPRELSVQEKCAPTGW
jgi:hypothetical protein